MGFRKKERVQLKTPAQIGCMRIAGKVVAETLETLRINVSPGMTTGDLDAIARECIFNSGATPSFLGYYGFPAVICTSINEEVLLPVFYYRNSVLFDQCLPCNIESFE